MIFREKSCFLQTPFLLLIIIVTFLVKSGSSNKGATSPGPPDIYSKNGLSTSTVHRHGLPYFENTTTQFTVQEGHHAFLNCKVHNLYNQTVSWIRNKDSHILFIGNVKFVDGNRFELLSGDTYGDWTLKIKFVTEEDDGGYECQVSTSPKIMRTFHLNVVVPIVMIINGDVEMHLEVGSAVHLECVISNCLEDPQVVFWYKNGHRILDSETGVAIHSVLEEDVNPEFRVKDPKRRGNGRRTMTRLSIEEATAGDAGMYSCSPSNLKSASINLHVIKDENPAAMQRENAASLLTTNFNSFSIAIILIFNQIS